MVSYGLFLLRIKKLKSLPEEQTPCHSSFSDGFISAVHKRSLLNIMLNRAFQLSSTWKFFHEECERLKEIFSRPRYPNDLVQATIRRFIESKKINADQRSMINADISQVYTRRKIKDEIKVSEDKPPHVSQQCVVYSFQCGLCDAGYVGCTCRHLHQRIEEHKGSAIGNHFRE